MGTFAMIVIFAGGTLVSVLFLVFALRMTKNLQRGQQDQSLYFRDFLEKTGYRLADMPEAPLEEQVQGLIQRYADPTLWQNGFQLDYVKQAYGRLVQMQIFYQGAHSSTCWRVPLDQPPPVQFQLLKGLKSKTTVADQIKLGDPWWDKNFKIFCDRPEELQRLLPDSGLRELLEPCLVVDLCVLETEVTFTDPQNKNVNAALGGLMGQALTGADPDKNQNMVIPVYNQITDLVLMAASLER